VREEVIGMGLEGNSLFLVEILFSNLLGEAERTHEQRPSGWVVFRPKCKAVTSLKQIRNVNVFADLVHEIMGVSRNRMHRLMQAFFETNFRSSGTRQKEHNIRYMSCGNRMLASVEIRNAKY